MICLTQIISLLIETKENTVIVHLEVDKNQFKKTIMPILNNLAQLINVQKSTPPEPPTPTGQ